MWKILRPSLLLALLLAAPNAWALSVGSKVSNVEIRDANNAPARIPNLGHKVLAIFYTDPDVSDQNDPFADLLKATNLPEERYQGMGIANMAEAPLKPNSIIRAIIRKKIAKYNSTILTDPDRILATAWGLGSGNDLSIVIIVDRQGTVRYIKRGAMSESERQAGLALIQQLILE
jgi:predicted transcriptional regulator